MKHAHKILIYTASIVLVASTSLWLILDNYFGQNEINSDNIASKSNTSETEITSSSPNSHDHGPVNTPTAFNEFQPIFIILTLALCMMSEFNNTAIIKYELTDASVLRRKNKSQKLTEIKQTLLFLSNSFINLLVMLLLCHYFSVLFIWACLGKFIGYWRWF